MEKEQVSQKLELSNSIVRCSYSLLTFQSSDSYSNMSCCDHVDIVSSIADGQSCLFRVTIAHHANNFSFLLGADTASQNHVGTFAEVYKLLHQVIILLNRR